MENFLVSARKFRPTTFDTVVGQQSITHTLKNAIKNKQLAQAFLFCGPRGVGKTSCARILAKTINCQNLSEQIEACNNCDSCNGFNNSHSFNIHELDAASNNGVDKIRDLVDQVRFAPQIGKYNIYIIDEVHMLSQAAFNAFLKTLEEPPAHAIFILATTEKHKILPTILSRCQIFDFKRIQIDDIVKHLEFIAKSKGINAEQDALHIIAQKADGALRDALSLFDQMASFSSQEISYKTVIENLNILDHDYYFKVTDAILSNSIANTLTIFDEILNNGFDGRHFINGLGAHLRNLLVCKDVSTLKLLETSQKIKEKYQTQSSLSSEAFLLKALVLCNKADLQYKSSKGQRLLVEITLMQLCGLNGEETNSPEAEKKTLLVKSQKAVKKNNLASESNQVVVSKELDAGGTHNKTEKKEHKVLESVVELKEKPKRKRTISINLNSLQEEEETSEELIQKNINDNPFTQKDLEAAWTNYATKTNLEGKHNLSSILKDKTPIISEEHTLTLTLNNKVQEEVFLDEKSEILSFLKKNLANDCIELKVAVDAIKPQEIKAYTPEDQFKKMVEKNPALLKMKDQFGLELDY